MALSDEKREEVKALLATGISRNSVAKKLGISWATVEIISREEPDKIENYRELKRVQFIDRIWDSMDEALRLGDIKIKLAKDSAETLEILMDKLEDNGQLKPEHVVEISNSISAMGNIPLSHISTYFGTLYDKQALMQGKSTSNVGVSGGMDNTNTDITLLTPDDRRARIEELNRRRGNGANSPA